MSARQSLMGGALIGACLLAFRPAAAEQLSDSEKIERLERQAELLQKQLKSGQSYSKRRSRRRPWTLESGAPQTRERCLSDLNTLARPTR